MIDVSLIGADSLGFLSDMYIHAQSHFGTDIIAASARKQKKIRKWAYNYYAELISELPQEISNCFSSEVSDSALISFLKDCYEQMQIINDKKKQNFIKDFAALDEAVKSAISKLLQVDFWPPMIEHGNNLEIIVDDNCSYRRSLIIENVNGIPVGKEGYLYDNGGFSLKQEDNRYRLFGELENPTDDDSYSLELTFTDAQVKIETYNCIDCLAFCENPWEYLCAVSLAISRKANLPGRYCNKQELDLLPLITEIAALNNWTELSVDKNITFPQLKSFIAQYEYDEIVKLFNKLETEQPYSNKFERLVNKLISLLSEQKYENIWRDIFEKIKASQTQYSNKVELYCPENVLIKTRMTIQKLMEQHGYSGTYLDFIKEDKLSGIHLEESYNMSYFVGMEKNAVFRIHCLESLGESGYFTVQLLCGTAFLRKNETSEDIYSCLFNAKGRRIFHTVHCDVPLCETDDEFKSDDIERCVNIAVKKAELRKLTKEERKEYYGNSIDNWRIFWIIFLFYGGLFGICMTIGFTLMAFLSALIFGQFSDIPSLLTEMPWWFILLFCWVGFGGLMGLITVLVKRK